MISVDRYVRFIVENKLSQPQFLLLILLHQKRIDLINLYKKEFCPDGAGMIAPALLDDLIARKFLIKKGDSNLSSHFELGKKFSDAFIDKFDAAEQLMAAYPAFLIKDGVRYPLTLMDENKLADSYWIKIKGDIEEHNQVMLDLEYAKSNGLICGKIETFISSRFWTRIRDERQGVTEPIGNFIVTRNDL